MQSAQLFVLQGEWIRLVQRYQRGDHTPFRLDFLIEHYGACPSLEFAFLHTWNQLPMDGIYQLADAAETDPVTLIGSFVVLVEALFSVDRRNLPTTMRGLLIGENKPQPPTPELILDAVDHLRHWDAARMREREMLERALRDEIGSSTSWETEAWRAEMLLLSEILVVMNKADGCKQTDPAIGGIMRSLYFAERHQDILRSLQSILGRHRQRADDANRQFRESLTAPVLNALRTLGVF